MNRTATVAILFLLAVGAWPRASAASGGSKTLLVAFALDSSRLVVAMDRGGIRLLSVPDLKEVRSFTVEGDHRLVSAAVSPGGRWLAASFGQEELRIWDLQSGEAQPSVPISRRSSLTYLFRPGTDMLLVYQDKLRLWDVKAGRENGVVTGINDIERMTVSPNGRYVVAFGSCPLGRVRGNVCLCSLDEKKVVVAADWEDLFFSLSPRSGSWNEHPDELAYMDDDQVFIRFGTITQPASYQSRILASADLKVLDNTSGKPVRGKQYSSGIRPNAGDQIEVVSPDGKWKATASAYMKRLFLYRVTAGDGRALEKFTPIP